jgi:hypothetical protein
MPVIVGLEALINHQKRVPESDAVARCNAKFMQAHKYVR